MNADIQNEEGVKYLFIETYGCQMNVADSEVIASVMRMAGYEPCDDADKADAILLNTCSIRDNAEQKILHRLDALNALRKRGLSLRVGVVGCRAVRGMRRRGSVFCAPGGGGTDTGPPGADGGCSPRGAAHEWS